VDRLTINASGVLTDTGESLAVSSAFNTACALGGGAGLVVTGSFPTDLKTLTYPPLLAGVDTRSVNDFGNSAAVVSPSGTEVFVRSSTLLRAFTYDSATGALGAAPFISQTVASTPSFFGVDHLAIHPDGSKLYVPEMNVLNVYDASSGAFITGITDPAMTGLFGVCLPQAPPVIIADIDIKFCSDPNAFNCKKKGVLPVTIFGTASFDVSDIDPSTLQLCLDDLSVCTTTAPRNWSIADRGDPTSDLGASMCAIDSATGLELHFLNPDTFPDFDAAFEASEVQTMLGDFCNGPKNGVSPTLVITGSTFGGIPIPISSAPIGSTGIDQLVKKGK
jgi:hypothetical protein